jgi:hypothetical protein
MPDFSLRLREHFARRQKRSGTERDNQFAAIVHTASLHPRDHYAKSRGGRDRLAIF